MKGGVVCRINAHLMCSKNGWPLMSSAPAIEPSLFAGSLISSLEIRSCSRMKQIWCLAPVLYDISTLTRNVQHCWFDTGDCTQLYEPAASCIQLQSVITTQTTQCMPGVSERVSTDSSPRCTGEAVVSKVSPGPDVQQCDNATDLPDVH